jgi:alkanesulfonate monooxygenase SsuD/methylene tetrahydromethanopterin reductase-like flavin-dependent oxidoreductase (luciferase family)
LPYTDAVDRLDEALQIIRRCFTSRGPMDFAGRYFRLEGAVMELEPPPAEIWIGVARRLTTSCSWVCPGPHVCR